MKSLKNQYSKYSDYFVEEIDYSNNELLNKVKNSINLIYSREACHKLEELIKKTKPDIAHVNLIYHQLTPSILHILLVMIIKLYVLIISFIIMGYVISV